MDEVDLAPCKEEDPLGKRDFFLPHRQVMSAPHTYLLPRPIGTSLEYWQVTPRHFLDSIKLPYDLREREGDDPDLYRP